MSEVAEAVSEAVEKARESRLNTVVAVCVALVATFMSLCNVKASNIVQGINLAQANAVDQWSFYQSKSTKGHIAEAAIDQLTLERDTNTLMTPEQRQRYDDAIKKQEANVKKYEKEKDEIKKQAEGFEKKRDELDIHNDQFDMAEALMSVAIALFGVTALTQKRWMLGVAGLFGGSGMFMGIAGLAKLSFHPDWLAKLLT